MKRLFTLSFFLMVTLGSTSFQRQVSAKSSDPNTEITQFEAAFSFALARNDIEQLQRYLADDWKVISGDGNTIDKKRFLQVIASGDLTHAKMTAENPTIRTYGNTALVTAHAQSTGTYKGAA